MDWRPLSVNKLPFLLTLYERYFKEYSFFSHPVNFLLFYPEADLEYVLWNKTIIFRARDSFGYYLPVYPWGCKALKRLLSQMSSHKPSFIKGCSLRDKAKSLQEGISSFRLIDWEFVYDLTSVEAMFRKRKNLLSKWEKLQPKVVTTLDKNLKKNVLALVREWAQFKKQVSPDWQAYIAGSMELVVEGFFRILGELSAIFRVVTIGIYLKDRLIGFSAGFVQNRIAFDLLEFTHPEFRGASSYLFYTMCIFLKDKGARWINTLGYSQIESLRYNKDTYRPSMLIPEYRCELNETMFY